MKQIIIAAAVVATFGSCSNAGNENAKELNKVKADTVLNAGHDTLQNPGTGAGVPPSKAPDSLSNSGSNDKKNETMKDSSKTKQ